jgi:hypothetical protein
LKIKATAHGCVGMVHTKQVNITFKDNDHMKQFKFKSLVMLVVFQLG